MLVTEAAQGMRKREREKGKRKKNVLTDRLSLVNPEEREKNETRIYFHPVLRELIF